MGPMQEEKAKLYFSSVVLCTVHGTRKYFIQEKKNFKTRSHNTIQTFKNYFPTVFSVFNFQQNERYPNKSLKCVWEWILD